MNDIGKQFREFINESKLQKKQKTLPEVFGIQFKEVYITKWISYLLAHESLGILILNAILPIINSTLKPKQIERIEEVYTEYTFEDGRRIDILVFTDKYIIGIENKIWSGEQYNQTSDYIKSLNEIGNHKEPIGIYLHPEENRNESSTFYNITYKQLLESLPADDSITIDEFTFNLYKEFKRYIKECLNLDFPEKNNAVTAYLKYYDDIQYAKKEYEQYLDWIEKWLKTAIETASNGKLISSTFGVNYWILVKNEKWRNIDFHFEVLWDKNKSIFDMKTLSLEVHLEGRNKKSPGDRIEELKECFKPDEVFNRNANNPIYKYPEQFGCDFSSAKKAKETIERIIDVFNSKEFTEYAKKADVFLKIEK